MQVILLILLVLTFGAESLGAQQREDPRAAELRQLSSLPGWAMTDERAKRMVENVAGLVLDQMWDAAELRALRSAVKPRIRASVEGRRRPAYVKANEIVIPVEYFELLQELSVMLAHDVYVTRGRSLDYPNPLLTRPYSNSPVLPLLDPLVLYVQNDYYFNAEPFYSCTKVTACAAVQQAEFSVVLRFVIWHELAHLAAHDNPERGDEYPLAQEIAADRKAWDALQTIAVQIRTSREYRAFPLAYAAGPLLILEFEAATKTGAGQALIKKREDALMSLVPPDLVSTVKRIILPRRESADFAHVILGSAAALPDLVVLDGIPLQAGEAIGKTLLLDEHLHQLIAAAGSRFAHEELSVDSDRGQKIELKYENLHPGVPSLAELEELKRQDNWFGVLLRTSTPNFQPKDRSLAYIHWNALAEVKMNDWIRPDPSVQLTEDQKLDLEIWTDRQKPLESRWRQ